MTNAKQIPCPAACGPGESDYGTDPGFGGTTLTVYDLPDDAKLSENLYTNAPVDETKFNWNTLSFGVNRRFRNNFFWNAYFDYQWRHEGRTTGQWTSPLGTDPLGVGWAINYGSIPLIQDITNWQLKSAGRYVMPYNIGTAATLRLVSGFNWAPLVRVNVGNVGNQTVYLDNISANRSDTVAILDFRVDKGVQLGDSAEIEFMLDLFNALNGAAETNFIMRAGGNFRETIEWIQGRTIGLSARLTF